MSEYVSPVYNVKAIPVEKIRANNYNPNKVAPPEMKLLEISIWEDGFTQPIVCYHDKANDEYIVVDGFHRFTTMLTSERGHRQGTGRTHGFDHPPQPRPRQPQRRSDEQYRSRAFGNGQKRFLDMPQYRHVGRRTAAAETNYRHCRPV